MSLFTKLFQYVLLTSNKFNIDESHSLSHSMNVLTNAYNIFKYESIKTPIIKNYEKIICVSAILHDMCDKKYMNEDEGIQNISNFLEDKITLQEIDITKKIITTMSYSTVKKNGFPDLGLYQHVYHIVREADLLAAYDFDRCMIYKMYKSNLSFEEAFEDAENLFNTRVFKHNEDQLFFTEYSKIQSLKLEFDAKQRINIWRNILNNNRCK